MTLETRSGSRSNLRAIGSLWFAAVLLVLLLVAMAYATVYESQRGAEQALRVYYHAWWFRLLLGLLALNTTAALVLRFPFSRGQVGFVMTHVGILITLGGALVTHYYGVDGQVALSDGESSDQFTVAGHESVLLWNSREQKRDTLDLGNALVNYQHPADITNIPAMKAGDVSVQVLRCFPDSDWEQHVLNDSPTSQPAIEVSLSPTEHDEAAWVFANHTTEVGETQVQFRVLATREELERLANAPPATQPASKGTVKVEYKGAMFEFPVEEGLERPVPLGDAEHTARVTRYLPHATVGGKNQIVNASDRPVNPYVEVELAGPAGTTTHRAFAKFPDFESMHGTDKGESAKVLLVATADTAPTTPVEILGGPDGQLVARFSGGETGPASRNLTVGDIVDTPWPGRKLAVLRRYDRARMQLTLKAIVPSRAQRTPGVVVRVSTAAQSNEVWLQKHQSQPFKVDDKSYELAYTDATRPLGFSVKLEHFQVGYYPGGMRPRSFESHVSFTDPAASRPQSTVISMNNPASFGGYGGYTFYQSSYRQEGGQSISILSVSRDWGQPIVFVGYIVLIVGMLIVLLKRMTERRPIGGVARG